MSEKQGMVANAGGKPKIIKEGYQPNDGAKPVNPPQGGSAVRPAQPSQSATHGHK